MMRSETNKLYQQCNELMGAAIDTAVNEHVDVDCISTYKLNQVFWPRNVAHIPRLAAADAAP